MFGILFNGNAAFMTHVKLSHTHFTDATSKSETIWLRFTLLIFLAISLGLFPSHSSLQVQAQYGTTAPPTSCTNISNQKSGTSLNLNYPIAGVTRVTISLIKDVNSGNLCFSTISSDQATVICDSIPGNPLLLLSIDYSGDFNQDSISSTTINSTLTQSANLQAGFCRSPFVATNLASTGGNQYSSTIPGRGIQVYAITGNLITVRSGLEEYNWWPVIVGSAFLIIGGGYTYIAYKMKRDQ